MSSQTPKIAAWIAEIFTSLDRFPARQSNHSPPTGFQDKITKRLVTPNPEIITRLLAASAISGPLSCCPKWYPQYLPNLEIFLH